MTYIVVQNIFSKRLIIKNGGSIIDRHCEMLFLFLVVPCTLLKICKCSIAPKITPIFDFLRFIFVLKNGPKMHLPILFGCIQRCISEIPLALIYEILLFTQPI